MSTYVIVAIQSGRSGTGKMCNKKDGSYADVETVMTSSKSLIMLILEPRSMLFLCSDIMDFIMSEISELDKFDEIHPKENYVMKVRSSNLTRDCTGRFLTTESACSDPQSEDNSQLDDTDDDDNFGLWTRKWCPTK